MNYEFGVVERLFTEAMVTTTSQKLRFVIAADEDQNLEGGLKLAGIYKFKSSKIVIVSIGRSKLNYLE